jgi:hypothetical protein
VTVNTVERREQLRVNQASFHARRRELSNRLKNRPCADCQGWFEPCQMDWDHRPGEDKQELVSRSILFAPTKTFLEEIAKCDLVCTNCHRLRTQKRLK